MAVLPKKKTDTLTESNVSALFHSSNIYCKKILHMYHIELYVFYRLLLTCTFYNSVLVTVHIHATCINYFLFI